MKFTTRQAAKPLSFAEAPAKPILPQVSVRFNDGVYTLDVNQIQIDFELDFNDEYTPCAFGHPTTRHLIRECMGKPKFFTESLEAFSKRCQLHTLPYLTKGAFLSYFAHSSDCFVNEATLGFIRALNGAKAPVSTEAANALLENLTAQTYGQFSIPGKWSEQDKWSTSNGEGAAKVDGDYVVTNNPGPIVGHKHLSENTVWDKDYSSLKKELEILQHERDNLSQQLLIANKTISALSAENNRMWGRKTRISCDSGLDD